MKPWRYAGGWALVTGASAGLGQIFAEELAIRGSHLILSARRGDRLESLARRLEDDHGVQALAIPADLAEQAAADRLWHAASSGRTIDLLVNNAGFGAQGRFDEVPRSRLTDMVRVNCLAVLELAHLALRDMRTRRHGGIINVASLAAFQPVPRIATYAATKAFVLSLSEALWIENRDEGIRVLALCPGRTPTEFQQVAGTGNADGAFGARAPREVVRAGLLAFEDGRGYVVPGIENLAMSWAARLAPRSLLAAVVKRVRV